MIAAIFGPGAAMIRTIEIENFRCFRHLKVTSCSRINVLVGDNGSGKTALLEALFLALSGNPSMTARLRQQRGLEPNFTGELGVISQALWGGFFHQWDMSKIVAIRLGGDGREQRSHRIFRGTGQTVLPLNSTSPPSEPVASIGLTFEWINNLGEVFVYEPKVTAEGIKFPESREDASGYFMFGAGMIGSARENAERFTGLSKLDSEDQFVNLLKDEYSWVEKISLESLGGVPVLHAKVRGVKGKIPLADVSSGINKIASIVLALSSYKRGVLLVDEIEGGIYFEHMAPFVRMLLNSVRESESQIFISTHSSEWLKAFSEIAITEKDIGCSLWRMSRNDGEPSIQRVSGEDLSEGLKFGEEVR